MTEVRLGLIGCGGVGRLVHFDLLRRMPGVRLMAVADLDPRHLSEVEKAGVAATTDTESLIGRSDIDGCIVAVPPFAHADLAVACLQRGKHVYVEKPLAASLADGQMILDAWRTSRDVTPVGMIGFNYRFNRLVQRARALLREDAVGTLSSIRSVFSMPASETPAWRRLAATGGGPLLELGSHHFDLVTHLLARPFTSVSAVRAKPTSDATIIVDGQLQGGLSVQSVFSIDGVDEDRIEITGSRGVLTIDRYRSHDAMVSTHQLTPQSIKARRAARLIRNLPYIIEKLRSPYHEPSFVAALTHFVQAIRRGLPAFPDLSDGYRSLEVATAAAQSLAEGRHRSL